MTEQNPGSTSRNMNKKRDDYLDWEDYFMATACLAAQRSKDPVTQVGACIVNQEKRIVGVGYNGMAFGCSDDEYSWGKEKNEDSKHLYVCHAEMNAILNKNAFDVKGCKLYVSLFPCNECTKLIIQSGIKHVVYLSEKSKSTPETNAAKRMFESAEVTTRKYRPKRQKITIDFEQKTST